MTIFDRRNRYRSALQRRDRFVDDLQRTMHQHDQIRRIVGARRACQNRLDNRRRNPAAATDMGGKWRPRSPAADPTQLRHPHDGVTWAAAEWQSASRLSADRVRLYARGAARLAERKALTQRPTCFCKSSSSEFRVEQGFASVTKRALGKKPHLCEVERLMKRVVSPCLAPSSKNCKANVVFPYRGSLR